MRTRENENVPMERGRFTASPKKHEANCDTNEATGKAFNRLQRAFTGSGHRLTRTIDPDGTVTLFAGCGMFSRELRDLAAAERFLLQIGGKQ
jgi:hypothetical protein